MLAYGALSWGGPCTLRYTTIPITGDGPALRPRWQDRLFGCTLLFLVDLKWMYKYCCVIYEWGNTYMHTFEYMNQYIEISKYFLFKKGVLIYYILILTYLIVPNCFISWIFYFLMQNVFIWCHIYLTVPHLLIYFIIPNLHLIYSKEWVVVISDQNIYDFSTWWTDIVSLWNKCGAMK